MLLVKKMNPNAVLPSRATSGSAGYDLCACLDAPVTVAPGETAKIPTGIAIQLDDPNKGAFVFARSGLATKHGLCPANAVGVVDSDYRGEIFVGLHNHSQEPYTIAPGERIAQLVVLPIVLEELQEVSQLQETQRGAGGFGSTGR